MHSVVLRVTCRLSECRQTWFNSFLTSAWSKCLVWKSGNRLKSRSFKNISDNQSPFSRAHMKTKEPWLQEVTELKSWWQSDWLTRKASLQKLHSHQSLAESNHSRLARCGHAGGIKSSTALRWLKRGWEKHAPFKLKHAGPRAAKKEGGRKRSKVSDLWLLTRCDAPPSGENYKILKLGGEEENTETSDRTVCVCVC